ncbi:glucan endo-1,3-beta-glucosidase 6-like [Apium graveolens]|uniref:glucan endo-1,3-beta-glucosidase 6-like n=1 Tax=Apium graveolens TaxID=4045 RepID=UPI003D7B6874
MMILPSTDSSQCPLKGPIDAYLFSLIDEDSKSIQPVSLEDSGIAANVSYAFENADCTSLVYGTSCANLDQCGNISFSFNSYYQQNNQLETACYGHRVMTVSPHYDKYKDAWDTQVAYCLGKYWIKNLWTYY